MKFISPKKPQYTKGMLVIESDDGYAGDFSHWLPLFTRLSRKYNSWHPNRAVVGNSAICSANTNANLSFMTADQLKKLERAGWEIMSHGRKHIGVGAKNVIAQANAGQKRIDTNLIGRTMPGYKYRIWNGATEEIVEVVSRTPSEGGEVNGYVTVLNPLINTYPVGSKFQLYDHAIEMGGCKSDLIEWGLNVKSHVFPYHDNDTASKEWASLYYESARAGDGMSRVDLQQTVDKYAIPSYYINSNTQNSAIDAMLQQVALNDDILIAYGHGEMSYGMINVLTHLIEKAFELGIRIGTHAQALERINSL